MLNKIVVKCLLDTETERCFISYTSYMKYFTYKKLRYSKFIVHSAQRSVCVNKEVIYLDIKIHWAKTCWQFHVLEG